MVHGAIIIIMTFCEQSQFYWGEKIWLQSVTKGLGEQGTHTLWCGAMKILAARRRQFCKNNKNGIHRSSNSYFHLSKHREEQSRLRQNCISAGGKYAPIVFFD